MVYHNTSYKKFPLSYKIIHSFCRKSLSLNTFLLTIFLLTFLTFCHHRKGKHKYMCIAQTTPRGDLKICSRYICHESKHQERIFYNEKQVLEQNVLYCITKLDRMSNTEQELEVNSVKIVYLLFLFDLEKFIVDTHDLFHLPFLYILSHTPTHEC